MSDTKTARLQDAIDKKVTGQMPARLNETGRVSLLPSNMTEAMEYAKVMATSGVMVRKHFQNNPGACVAVCQVAWDCGMQPYMVQQKTYLVGEMLGFESQLVHAIVNSRAPLSRRLRHAYSGQGQTRKVKVTGWLKGEDEPFEYETPELGQIKIQNSPLWKSDPDQQLHYFAVRSWARRHVPEVLLGVYTREEIEAGLNNNDDTIRIGDAPPAPRREDFARETAVSDGDETAEAMIPFITEHGEELLYTPGDFYDAFLAAMQQAAAAGQWELLASIWENNSGQQFADLRKTDSGKAATKALHNVFLSLEAKMTAARKADNAAEQQAGPASPETSSTAAETAGPSRWVFTEESGGKTDCGSAASFVARMLDGIKATQKLAGLMRVHEPVLAELYRVDPDQHQAIRNAATQRGWFE